MILILVNKHTYRHTFLDFPKYVGFESFEMFFTCAAVLRRNLGQPAVICINSIRYTRALADTIQWRHLSPYNDINPNVCYEFKDTAY